MSSSANWCISTDDNSLVAVTLGTTGQANRLVLVEHRRHKHFFSEQRLVELHGCLLLDKSLGLDSQLGAPWPHLRSAAPPQQLASRMLQPASQDSHRSRLAMPPFSSKETDSMHCILH